ncbi:Tic22 family protein [Gloeobacter violaceus]|uniref:Glr1754 protein n=1 Tax=Gloeobacter violaceus (strain ATCC 29082 / PCC 7421) TaxID=251221 RepID=Q7NJS8_GLOVI|nr:Tic22 family protein [Gloeobacter violaceus]BAC89695.1 glr1754 [Gloeobacter violaceus PCC 7421]
MQQRSLQRVAALGFAAFLTSLMTCTPARAIPEDEVIKKLDSVPVFLIADTKGNPLIVTVKDDKTKKDTSILWLFLDQNAAKEAYGNLQKSNDKAAKESQIGVISLGQAFKAAKEEQKKKENKVNFQFQSDPKTVTAALDLAKKVDPKTKDFPGIPVFYAMGTDEKTKAKGFVTFEKDNKQYVPLFFDKDDLERNVDQIKRSKPELAKQMNIEVAPLDAVVGNMLEGKNDTEFNKLTFVPSFKAVEYVQSLKKAAAPGAAPASVTPASSAPKP